MDFPFFSFSFVCRHCPQFTLELWFRPAAATSLALNGSQAPAVVFLGGEETFTEGFAVRQNGTDLLVTVAPLCGVDIGYSDEKGGGCDAVLVGAAADFAAPMHLAVTLNATVRTIYINGSAVDTASIPFPFMSFGRLTASSQLFLFGQVGVGVCIF